MIKKELIRETAKATEFNQEEIESVIDQLLEIIREELKAGGNIKINQFGKFYIKNYPGREVITPQGETIKVDAKAIPGFKPSRYFKDYCNGLS